MEIQRSRRIGALAVSCDAYPVIDQKLLHSRDFLRIYQGRAGEEKVVRPADFRRAALCNDFRYFCAHGKRFTL